MPRSSAPILALIERIERDLERLKRLVEGEQGGKEGPSARAQEVKLEGLWEGLEVDEALLEEAERSLFKGIQAPL